MRDAAEMLHGIPPGARLSRLSFARNLGMATAVLAGAHGPARDIGQVNAAA